MAERPRGMGRGLAAILSVVPREDDDLRSIPVDLIAPSHSDGLEGLAPRLAF